MIVKRIAWGKNRFYIGLAVLLMLQISLPFLAPKAAHASPLVPQVLKDINPVSGSGINDFTQLGDITLFVANDDTHGQEIWKTDGTADGTVLVKDIYPGTTNSQPRSLTALGDRVYFIADTVGGNREIYKTDGTSAGTTKISDFSTDSGYAGNIVGTYNNELYFSANDGTNGLELWKTDGITYQLVKDINPTSDGSAPSYGTVLSGALYFYAQGGDASTTGLYKTDGTTSGTTLVKGDMSINNMATSDKGLFKIGNTLFFNAYTTAYGNELWKSDGTTGGTTIVKDIRSGTGSSGPSTAAVANGTLYFRAFDTTHGEELWKSDGTEAGTVLVKDLNGTSSGSSIQNITAIYDKVLFSSNSGGINGVYISNGTAAGTVKLTSSSEPVNFGNHFIAYGDKVFFSGTTTTAGTELWQTNGTIAGTSMVADTVPGSDSLNPSNFFITGQTLLFSGTIPGSYDELYKMDLPPMNVTDQNNDGVPDGFQPNIGSVTAAGKTVVVDTSTNCAVTSPTAVDESSLANQDSGYNYPTGLLNFGGTCALSGSTTTIQLYFYDTAKSGLTLRKYNPNTKQYTTITEATLSETTINGHTVTVASYDVTDGGPLDMDGTVNGSFTDPVGLAQVENSAANTESLADTGSNMLYIVVAGLMLIAVGGIVMRKQLK